MTENTAFLDDREVEAGGRDIAVYGERGSLSTGRDARVLSLSQPWEVSPPLTME